MVKYFLKYILLRLYNKINKMPAYIFTFTLGHSKIKIVINAPNKESAINILLRRINSDPDIIDLYNYLKSNIFNIFQMCKDANDNTKLAIKIFLTFKFSLLSETDKNNLKYKNDLLDDFNTIIKHNLKELSINEESKLILNLNLNLQVNCWLEEYFEKHDIQISDLIKITEITDSNIKYNDDYLTIKIEYNDD